MQRSRNQSKAKSRSRRGTPRDRGLSPHTTLQSSVSRPIRDNTTVQFRFGEYNSGTTIQPQIGFAYRANDLYDPQVQVGGHQPLGFDQWMTLYSRFTVIKSSIQFYARADLTHFTSITLPGDANYSITNPPEFPHTVWQLFQANSAPAGQVMGSVFGEVDVAKHFGVPSDSILLGDSDFSGDVSASPASQCYYLCLLHQPGAAALGTWQCYALITYTARLTQNADIPAS